MAGGDLAESNCGVHADIVVVGSVPRGTAVLRSGARPGDYIYVTGELGASAAMVAAFAAGGPNKETRRSMPAPRPRLAAGQWLRKKRLASAMIDVSDGLSTDLEHICQESGVGAEIEENAIPRARVGNKQVALGMALHGGEDYELLFTSGKKIPTKIAGIQVRHIGEIAQQRGIRIRDEAGRVRSLEIQGWEHFRKGKGQKSDWM